MAVVSGWVQIMPADHIIIIIIIFSSYNNNS